MLDLNQIIEISKNDNHVTEITVEKINQAKTILLSTPKNNKQLLKILVAMNLINAALKRKEFKSKEKDALIHYGMLKPRVTSLFHNIISNSTMFDIDFYVNEKEKCAYIEINELQFSFHNITIDEPIKAFLNSTLNHPKPWGEIRLQKVSGELFDFFVIEKN